MTGEAVALEREMARVEFNLRLAEALHARIDRELKDQTIGRLLLHPFKYWRSVRYVDRLLARTDDLLAERDG